MTSPRWIESGDPSWPVWLVAEAPGEQEIAQGRPLCGQSGQELDRMLLEAGWPRPERLFRTNICHERPSSYYKNGKAVHNDIDQFFPGVLAARRAGLPQLHGRYYEQPVQEGLERLRTLAHRHRPQLIISLGNTSLWGLCGHQGITKWRGSTLESTKDFFGCKVVCTFHPADVLRRWPHRQVVVQDLRRALRESQYPEIRKPSWQFVVAPTVADVADYLQPLIEKKSPLVCDTEGWGVVDCIGFASSSQSAICIPFVHETEGGGVNYWSVEDECRVLDLVVKTLRSCPQTFHNALWDCQVLAAQWGLLPNLAHDTMVAQHVAFPGLLGGKIHPVTGKVSKEGSSLSLSFIASMYCEYYRFWKDDGRLFDPTIGDERDYWSYNCEDCVRTWECRESLLSTLQGSGLWDQYQLLMSWFAPVLEMMFRGLRLDRQRVLSLRREITALDQSERQWLRDAVGFDLNPGSSKQMQAFFYGDLGCPVQTDRKTRQPTLDDDALQALSVKRPLLLPLIRKIQNIRSLAVAQNNFLAAAYEGGDRLRCALNITGTETFRFSSNENAFGEGCNLQNLTRAQED